MLDILFSIEALCRELCKIPRTLIVHTSLKIDV